MSDESAGASAAPDPARPREPSCGEPSTGEQRSGEQRSGESSTGEQRSGEQRSGEQRSGESSTGEQRSDEPRSERPGTQPRPRSTLRRVATLALVTVLIGWIVHNVATEAARTDWAALQPAPLPLVGAAAVLLATYLFRASLWTFLLRSMGESIRTSDGCRVFLGAQLGRYLPGKLWQIAGASLLARRYGVAPGAAATAAMVTVLVHHLVGGALALMALEQVARSLWMAGGAVLSVAVGGLALLASPLFPRSVRWLGRRTGRSALAELTPPAPKTLLAVTPGFLLVWLAFALALWLVTRGLFPGLPGLGATEAIGAMAAAAVLGFAVLIAPSGLGVREAVLVTLLEPALGVVAAGVVAIAMRILMTLVELSLSIWGALPHLRGRRDARASG